MVRALVQSARETLVYDGPAALVWRVLRLMLRPLCDIAIEIWLTTLSEAGLGGATRLYASARA